MPDSPNGEHVLNGHASTPHTPRPPLMPNSPGDPRIRTFTGRLINPFAMLHDDIDILDIAHALAHTCRFGGHTTEFYSVAQHSVHVASLLDGPVRLYGLLHDAAEAYLGDVVGPLKSRTHLAPAGPWARAIAFEAIEERLLAQIMRRFDMPPITPEIAADVARADRIMLDLEMNWFWRNVSPSLEPVTMPACLAAHEAKTEFLRSFHAMQAERAALANATARNVVAS